MPRVTFSVPSVTPKQRPRWSNKTKRMFTPKETADAEEAVAWAYRAKARGAYAGKLPVRLRIVARKRLPKGTPKRVESQPFTVKPDWDNVGKLVSDALNGVAYDDDSQVVECTVVKEERTRCADKTTVTVEW